MVCQSKGFGNDPTEKRARGATPPPLLDFGFEGHHKRTAHFSANDQMYYYYAKKQRELKSQCNAEFAGFVST
jgi:hypothetical protein